VESLAFLKESSNSSFFAERRALMELRESHGIVSRNGPRNAFPDRHGMKPWLQPSGAFYGPPGAILGHIFKQGEAARNPPTFICAEDY
jgi:hypothetical protein